MNGFSEEDKEKLAAELQRLQYAVIEKGKITATFFSAQAALDFADSVNGVAVNVHHPDFMNKLYTEH